MLHRLRGQLDYWVGLSREQPGIPWRWTDNSTYSNHTFVRGQENYGYLNNNGISSARVYVDKRWICWKPIAGLTP